MRPRTSSDTLASQARRPGAFARAGAAPRQLQVFVPRLLIKRKHTLPIAVGAAAAAVVLALFAAGASAHTGPRIALGYAEPVEMPYAVHANKLGCLLFCSHHEMLHAGQLGLLRRLLGKEPIR